MGRKMRGLACKVCQSTEDPDRFAFVFAKGGGGKTFPICLNCRTCRHNYVAYRCGSDDVCYICARSAFTQRTLWGRRIFDVEMYFYTGVEAGWTASYMLGWRNREVDQLSALIEQNPQLARSRRDNPYKPPWLPPHLWGSFSEQHGRQDGSARLRSRGLTVPERLSQSA